jgi:hypothetical protein
MKTFLAWLTISAFSATLLTGVMLLIAAWPPFFLVLISGLFGFVCLCHKEGWGLR